MNDFDGGKSVNIRKWLLTIFYIPYIAFEWMALMYKIVPPRRFYLSKFIRVQTDK